jgi:hypothetical protein
MASNDLQNTTHKTRARVTRTLLKTGVNSGALKSFISKLNKLTMFFVS